MKTKPTWNDSLLLPPFLYLFIFIVSLSPSYSKEIIKELSPQELQTLKEGKEIIKTFDKEGHIWPEVKVYRYVKSHRDSIKSLFLDYEGASNYIQSLQSATVEASPNEHTKDVRYILKLPLPFKITYLIRNQHTEDEYGHTFTWRLLESKIINSAQGNLRIQQVNNDKTKEEYHHSLICYSNHLEPKTSLLRRFKNQAIKEASKTTEAIKIAAEKKK
jgi:hypothetical protein